MLAAGPQGGSNPRVCGGTAHSAAPTAGCSGLSPRVRGNPAPAALHCRFRRSIPACAGEPTRISPTNTRRPVYPRVCGGTLREASASEARLGLSPRVRGNRCASRLRLAQRPGVYPRVCGGTAPGCIGKSWERGLSPRVRGNRGQRRQGAWRRRSIPACAGNQAGRAAWAGAEGSIPACAGEPPAGPVDPPLEPVYPRVCGGTGQLVRHGQRA